MVELEQDGLRGYGEAGESDFYGATLDSMTGSLEAVTNVPRRSGELASVGFSNLSSQLWISSFNSVSRCLLNNTLLPPC